MPSSDPPVWRGRLFQYSVLLHTVVQTSLQPLCRAHGLTLLQFRLLSAAELAPGQTVGSLSAASGILRSNVAAVCAELVERGFLDRVRDPRDRRRITLSLTEPGRTVLRRIESDLCARYQSVLDGEPQETFDRIQSGLEALCRLAGKLEACR